MTYKELKNQLKTGLAPLYLFYGEEVFLRDYMTDRLIRQAVPEDARDFNFLILTSDTLSPEAVSDFFEAYPFMAERKLLCIKHAGLFSAKASGRDAYLHLLSDIPAYVTVLISEDTPDKRGALYKALAKTAVICDFAYLDRPELKRQLESKLSAAKKDMRREDMEYLLDLCGPDLTNLRLQIEKLCAYTGQRQTITRDDMDKTIVPPLCNRVYDISEAVLSKNSAYALRLLSDLKKSGESGVRILSILGGYFSDLARAYALSQETMSYSAMLEAMHLPPNRRFVADKLFKRVKTMKGPLISSCLSACTKAESDIKNGWIPEWTALEMLVLQFLNL